MKDLSETFSIPREQFLSWRYLTVVPRPDSLGAPNGAHHFFFWARNAIYHGLRALGISPRAHVLLPAYVCKAAVEPFAAYGMAVQFYDIGRDGTPVFSEIEAKVGPRTEAILAVHYFGFPQQIQTFRELCDRRRLALFEDCAHVLRGETQGQPLGSFGDASVFSYRKFLPMYDGAELCLSHGSGSVCADLPKETLPFSLRVTKHLLDQTLDQSESFLSRTISFGIDTSKKVWNLARISNRRLPGLHVDNNSASFDLSLVNQPMSGPSRWVLRHSTLAPVMERRRENFLYLAGAIRGMDGVAPLHHELPENVCPWVFPVFFDALPNAHQLLRQMGIPAVTWGGVRPPGVSPEEFPDAHWLYENAVFLPIHQNLSRNAIDCVIRAVEKVRHIQYAPKPHSVPAPGSRHG